LTAWETVDAMIFRQITHDDLGCASYLIGDEDAGVAAVVDPKLEIGEYLALARYMGVRIEHILETHNHADHVSGHGRLAAATGATIHIHRNAAPDYDHEPFDDGWEFALGAVRVRALHTPGHRPEHTAFALIDTARGPEPWAVLTGDTLFVGDIARPDLAVDKEEGARGMFASLREKLLTLPGECEVWPGHLGGSLCGGPGMDMKVSSTIAYEHAHNDLLAEDDEDVFVARAIGSLAPQPPNFQAIVAVNRGPLHSGHIDVEPLTARQVSLKQAEGALVIDVRTDLQFDDAHIPGAVCNPAVRAGFGTKLAWVADRDQQVLLVGRDDQDAVHAAHLAAAIGITHVARLPRGRDDQLARGQATDREHRAHRRNRSTRAHRRGPSARRPRTHRVGGRPPTRRDPRALPRASRDPRRDRRRPAGRSDLLLRATQRAGRLAARPRRRSTRDPRRRRRSGHLAGPRLAD
jgi:hydroxyacylglutathione hydrolase